MVRNAGWRVGVWTVNDPVLARQLLSWGVDTIFTDVLDLIEPGTNTQNKEARHV
jgi:glycerophosphoryl diester phosphodiesterase